MGGVLCCCTQPVDFDGEVDLYHFDLLRAVGKGAFGKVSASAGVGNSADLRMPGARGRAQAYQETLRAQVYRQGEMHQAEGRRQYYPGAPSA